MKELFCDTKKNLKSAVVLTGTVISFCLGAIVGLTSNGKAKALKLAGLYTSVGILLCTGAVCLINLNEDK